MDDDGLEDLDEDLSADESDLESDLDGDDDEDDDEDAVRAIKKRKTTAQAKQVPTGAKRKRSPSRSKEDAPAESPAPSEDDPPPPAQKSIDDLPYDQLTLDQKIARNKKRNALLAKGLKEDLHALFDTFPKKRPVPRPRKPREPCEKNVPPTRRSRRLANGGEGGDEDVASGSEDRAGDGDNGADDADEGGGGWDESEEVRMARADGTHDEDVSHPLSPASVAGEDIISSRPASAASALGGDVSSRASSPPPTENEEGMDIDGDGLESDSLEMEFDTGDKEAAEEGGGGAQNTPDTTTRNPAPPAPPLLRPTTLEPTPIRTQAADAPNIDILDAHDIIAQEGSGGAQDNPDTTTRDLAPAPIRAETADAPDSDIPDAPDITVQHPLAVSNPPSCPPRTAEWFSHALGEVTKVNLGAHFNALLEAWTRMEAACGFENAKPALPKKHRPEQVDRWIRDARGRRNRPNPPIKKLQPYELEWWAWWDGLQPEWRKKDADGSWVVGGAYGKDWDTLTYWGENGLLSVVASLYFWGCAVQDEGNGEERWERAVNDVAWILEGLALFYESFKKR
jgi:hypothetical protein